MSKIKFQKVLDYESIFGELPPINRLELLKGINLMSIIVELARINYRLKPKDKVHQDITFKKQIELIQYYTKDFRKYFDSPHIPLKYLFNKKDYPIIFNRYACLLGIEEILSIPNIDLFIKQDPNEKIDYEIFLKYYLAINTQITQIRREDDFEATLENLNPKSIPLNESMIYTDPIFTAIRGIKFIKWILSKQEYSALFKEYFELTYNTEPLFLIYKVFGLLIYDSKENIDFHFIINSAEKDVLLFNSISKRIKIENPEKLLSIKKNPLIRFDNNKFLITDLSFLIEKISNQMAYDFWYDYLSKQVEESGKTAFRYETYRGDIGLFYEGYISTIIEQSFSNFKYFKVVKFNELKLNTVDDKELTDIYIRYSNKVFLCEVKSGMLSDDAKLGGDVASLYNQNKNKFFSRFGLDQLVNAIKALKEHVISFDPKFPIGKTHKIYPALLVADKVFQTPFMAQVFNTKFKLMCYEITDKKIQIQPLTIIHITDFERMQDSFSKNPMELWTLLENNFKGQAIIPPLYLTVNNNTQGREYPNSIIDEFIELIKLCNPEGDDK